MDIQELKGKVDFGIITIREDEFEAVLKRFPPEDNVIGRRRYEINRLKTDGGKEYLNVLVRCPEQGTGEAQNVARDLIEDFDPQWILLIGIAGGVPADEFTLGDVVAALRLLDFSVTAHIEKETESIEESGVAGGPMQRQVQDLLAQLPAMSHQLEGWNSEASIGTIIPPVVCSDANFYGDEPWRTKVRESLERHFGENRRLPRVTTGSVASSDRLVKDTKVIRQWREGARQILAVEMELAGVYRAARTRHKEYPILAIRGISDIVGFKRHSDWTSYACNTAASFALSLLKTEPVPPRNP